MEKKEAYHSKKHPVLEYIFEKYYSPDKPQEIIPFFLSDISEGYKFANISEPVSISNTILDLTRQDRGIDSRVPKSISKLGYDLRKKTGADSTGHKYAGEFVFVGIGKLITSWLIWPDKKHLVVIDSSSLPSLVARLIRPDEGGLFSVIDYTDVFSKILHNGKRKIYRIQNPMKWQPNEIDGFYASEEGKDIDVYPVEAKSLITGDEINMDQLKGAFITVREQLQKGGLQANIQQIAVKMIENGMDIAVFPINKIPITPEVCYRIEFRPPISRWQKAKKRV